ncbi:hypothetical protein COW36_10255 [bacterium (Candidatus Blackallbacteria) CG17_big_fil_post_rev_8_21_14_2_50_48_46]|uniref:Uncharacterized protein n=1 Tax=bacterium (Candidatus Blackallbacteria) CG17_big_fil_post_rev_8_21_14_2_50_48_46 TaxID=2014261 RepID=A0A2M7G5Z3_9BACT|nr:MAG: hypothetical protein COW64_20025 [bacterium (Candidatus Blackallbacteria) CG18_big_fil_WC_8_21_14_2_50_49_26]PIW17015.1 MAG: hypothetical protein COW36_10255 [bacterium (Candidatus Blackallbacteria) CG17_big_fil_post_rev_8_21_14_2_50_48_46]PIW48177.1 MAG: hypothetical protein COW20_10420 [bacterium (Candidatus Blackallbacteria) CG13_big_fil_rev_8_21_14_2_50_49_14]
MTHISGHPTLDRMMHAAGSIFTPNHQHGTSAPAQTTETPAFLGPQDQLVVKGANGIPATQEAWVPFKSSKTGAAVGAMTGVIVGTVAGFASAAAIGVLAKDPKMALSVGASVYLTSIGAGAVAGAVGYKTRSMNIDTTEPPMGSLFDTPEQARINMEKSKQIWEKAGFVGVK